MSPEYVRPYVKAQKNDDRDAEGIAEAASRPTMRFVDLKSEEQLDIQSLHWVRSRLVAERTTLINQMRAILLERGLIFSAGRCKFESAVDSFLNEQASSLSERVQKLVAELRDEWKMLDTKIAALNAEFLALARDDPATRRLTAIPGIGVLNATALIAAIGNASSFDCARDSWRDNVFVERLWRSIKYEEVYLHAYKTVSEARAGIRRYLGFYNTRRPHSSLDRQTPDQAYFNALARTHPSWAALCSE
jgi:transposase